MHGAKHANGIYLLAYRLNGCQSYQRYSPNSNRNIRYEWIDCLRVFPVIHNQDDSNQIIIEHFQDHLYQLEYEGSHKSDFELRHEDDIKLAALIKDGKKRVDLDEVSKATAQDLVDRWSKELKQFQLSSRTTEADTNNDVRSTDRKLAYPLTLLMEQQLANDKLFLLPQGKVIDGETLNEAAKRIISELCGDQLQTTLYGNAPCGFYKYKYPTARRDEIGSIGAKLFFYRAIHRSGQVDATLKRNYQWLEKSELFDKIKAFPEYSVSLNKFIIWADFKYNVFDISLRWLIFCVYRIVMDVLFLSNWNNNSLYIKKKTNENSSSHASFFSHS